jgi:hypothetical protein
VRTIDGGEFEMLLKFVGAVPDECENEVAGKDRFFSAFVAPSAL